MYSEEFNKGYRWAIDQHNKEVRQYFILALTISTIAWAIIGLI